MRRTLLFRVLGCTVFAALAVLGLARTVAADNGLSVGLTTTFTEEATKASDTTVSQNVWLYVPAGQSPTPFLPAGKFTAVWEGFVSAELRDDFTFHATANGKVKVEANGKVVLEADGTGKALEPSQSVRLNKGTNAFKVTLTSADSGDTFLRLNWSSSEIPNEPIADAALHYTASDALTKANELRLGRELFVEHRCHKCHQGDFAGGIPDLNMDAPTFDGIGSRRQGAWLAKWIADPTSLRDEPQMPKMLHGDTAAADAEAIAQYLASLTGEAAPAIESANAEAVDAGKTLFEKLHCVACHVTPGDAKQPNKILLTHVAQKFTAADLVAFLQKPDAHYKWIRMPDFKLKEVEATQIAAYLTSKSEAPDPKGFAKDDAKIEQGRKLTQSLGCLNCHSGKVENQFTTKALADVKGDAWKKGCLGDDAAGIGKAPDFGFKPEERAALRAFAAVGFVSLKRHVPAEFAQRQVKNLNCVECHGKFEGFPVFPILGGKLKPEWAHKFIAGEVDYKPRHWLESRMPAFKPYAEGLAHGLAHQHGYPAKTPEEKPIDEEAAKIGRVMVSADGGFSCVACHGVGSMVPTQVFESEGINLAYSYERLQPEFYHRWLLNPLRIDPVTKMPVYFDQGRSPLTDHYDGDAAKQIDAVWQYIRKGKDMPLPNGAH